MSRSADITLDIVGLPNVLSVVDMMLEFYASEQWPLDYATAHSSLLRIVSNPARGWIWTVFVNGLTAGYVIITRGGEDDETSWQHATIEEFYICPAFHDPELSSQVVDLALSACREIGIRAFHQSIGRWYCMTRWL